MVRYSLLFVLFASLVIPAALNQREAGNAHVFCGTPSALFGMASQGNGVLAVDTNILSRFELWAKRYVADLSAAGRPSEKDGVVLARERRITLEQLIENDPQSALAAA